MTRNKTRNQSTNALLSVSYWVKSSNLHYRDARIHQRLPYHKNKKVEIECTGIQKSMIQGIQQKEKHNMNNNENVKLFSL